MKKIIALILAGLMILTLAACNIVPGNDKETDDTVDTNDTVDTEENGKDSESSAESDAESESESDATDNVNTADVSIENVASALINKYAEYVNIRGQYDEYMASLENDEYATEEDKNMTYETYLSYQLIVQPIEKDAEWLQGFLEKPTGYSECYNYIPSSMNPFMGYVFRLEEGTDIEAFKKTLTETCDLRWMLCRDANTIICENYGDIVLFQMCVVINEDYPDGFTSEQKQGFIDTFFAEVQTPADAE